MIKDYPTEAEVAESKLIQESEKALKCYKDEILDQVTRIQETKIAEQMMLKGKILLEEENFKITGAELLGIIDRVSDALSKSEIDRKSVV